MKILNDGLPPAVFETILATQAVYDKGDSDISVTELINPPRMRCLKKLHWDEIEVKASSLLNVTLGSAFHHAVQSATKTGIAERRLTTEIQGWKLSGGMDHYNDGVLSDYKTCNKWKTVYATDGKIDEFEKQLNVYAHILRKNDVPVHSLKIFALFKDWNRPEYDRALKKGDVFDPYVHSGYPEKEWLYFDIKMWTPEDAELYVMERIVLHQEAEKNLPQCPASELYGGRRCERYCDVGMNGFCEQFNNRKKQTFKTKIGGR